MLISTRGRYATRIMVRLAMQDKDTPLRRTDLARDEDLSADYIEQIMMKLKSPGLVHSRRGARGGFLLGRDAAEITVEEVLRVTEGAIELAPCGRGPCERADACPARPLWEEASTRMAEVLRGATIQSLADRQRNRDSVKTVYAI